ncbi:MAG: hypothetical protein ACI9WC_002044 [Arenicella sp.]|jgi:hypothetical protein
MGIVICVAMALGLIAFMPMPWREPDSEISGQGSLLSKIKSIAPVVLVTAGAWNTLWYGLQNAASFWGKAGLITGLVMILSAVLLTTQLNQNKIITFLYNILKPFRLPLFVTLLASFLLYLVTLIQLNLGLPIIS